MGEALGRVVLEISGEDRSKFLQGLVSNDVPAAGDGLIYAALLTPQGKYLADFFMLGQDTRILIDVAAPFADALAARLAMYKLRADVAINASDIQVARGLGSAPPDALPDPRHPALGWRHYGSDTGGDGIDWDAIRVAQCIPESGIELITNDTYILEAGFERLNGVDFKKGCYVGQEVTARMKHKTELKKGLAPVSVVGSAPVGTPVLAGGKPVGTLFTQSGRLGIAHLRFERAKGVMQAGEAQVVLENMPTSELS